MVVIDYDSSLSWPLRPRASRIRPGRREGWTIAEAAGDDTPDGIQRQCERLAPSLARGVGIARAGVGVAEVGEDEPGEVVVACLTREFGLRLRGDGRVRSEEWRAAWPVAQR
ncbi:hypothetical protein Psuf_068310 [Phytohabitans suffuscus]|uniref:Uncharacterized protein n=1 Tax=Phytohabitans suffuscus TaxID=624315 RepID=A0A6F8YUA7_9ACTN|nr:hypothetical protein Psuf_068310 [Phytohabitans suffuscus]